jgi:hypothetical protein
MRKSTAAGQAASGLEQRLTRVRRMVRRAEDEKSRYEAAGLSRLAQEKAREKRYWQFVQAVLELKPWGGQTLHRGTVH